MTGLTASSRKLLVERDDVVLPGQCGGGGAVRDGDAGRLGRLPCVPCVPCLLCVPCVCGARLGGLGGHAAFPAAEEIRPTPTTARRGMVTRHPPVASRRSSQEARLPGVSG